MEQKGFLSRERGIRGGTEMDRGPFQEASPFLESLYSAEH